MSITDRKDLILKNNEKGQLQKPIKVPVGQFAVYGLV